MKTAFSCFMFVLSLLVMSNITAQEIPAQAPSEPHVLAQVFDGNGGYFEISGRIISGKVNTSGNQFGRNVFGWSLFDDIKTFAIPLKGKESSEMIKVVVKYLAGHGSDAGLQLALNQWR